MLAVRFSFLSKVPSEKRKCENCRRNVPSRAARTSSQFGTLSNRIGFRSDMLGMVLHYTVLTNYCTTKAVANPLNACIQYIVPGNFLLFPHLVAPCAWRCCLQPPVSPLSIPPSLIPKRIGQDVYDVAFITDADGVLLELLHRKITLDMDMPQAW